MDSRSSRASDSHVFPRIVTWPELGREKSFEDFDGCSLAGAVRAEQAEALSALDLEVEPAHGFHFAVVGLAQVTALNG